MSRSSRRARSSRGSGRRWRCRRGRPATGGEFERALEDDFNTPAVLALLHGGHRRGARDELARGLDLFGICRVRGAGRGREFAGGGRARAEKDWPAADAARDELEAAGWAVTDHPGGTAVWLGHDATAELVYGRRAVREALRGRREVLELFATERAAREDGRKPKIVAEKVLTELAGTRDHQGVLARVEPFRYADAYELAEGSRCSSRSTR